MPTYPKLFDPYGQLRRKIITSISKEFLPNENRKDKENRSPNKQTIFHSSRKHITPKYNNIYRKGGRRNKTRKLSRIKSKKCKGVETIIGTILHRPNKCIIFIWSV